MTVDVTSDRVKDTPEEETNGYHADDETFDPSALFDAPDYASWLKTTKSNAAKEYEKKANSFLKMVMTGFINAGQWPDAAAVIDRGPAWASAVGDFAASDEHVAKAIDMIMSPDSPTWKFVMTSIPLVSQLWRNHESEVSQVAAKVKQTRTERKAAKKAAKESGQTIRVEKTVTRKIGRFTIKIPVRLLKFRFHPGKLLAGFRSGTVPPEQLAYQVFSDRRVVEALRKQGIYLGNTNNGQNQDEE